MRQRGFEPPRGFPHGRLRTARIPFRHCRAEQSIARNPSELDANIRSRIMHAPQAVAESLELHRLGLNAVEISPAKSTSPAWTSSSGRRGEADELAGTRARRYAVRENVRKTLSQYGALMPKPTVSSWK